MSIVEIIDYQGEAAIVFTPEMLAGLGNPKAGDDLTIQETAYGIEIKCVEADSSNQ